MLTNQAAIISDTFRIQFNVQQVYLFAFPPTVYELLWRYEYISFRQQVLEDQADNSKGAAGGRRNTLSIMARDMRQKRPVLFD